MMAINKAMAVIKLSLIRIKNMRNNTGKVDIDMIKVFLVDFAVVN